MEKMPNRQLGKNGPQVSAIGFGAMGLSAFYGTPASDEERFKVLDRTIELGCTFIDTADVYGDNEELIGKYFKTYPERRKKVFLATKFGNVVSPEGKFSVRGDAEYVSQAFERKTVSAMKELVQNGKVKYIGLSECSSDTIRRAHAVHPISCVQIEYSPFSLDIERDDIALLKTCRELGVAIICYSPLGRGLLTGQYQSPDDFEENDFRRSQPRFSKENFPKNLELVNYIKELAKKKNCTPGQLTLSWILAQGDDFIPIPGTTKIKNLEENIAAVHIHLTDQEVKEIREACAKANIVGERYSKQFCSNLYGDSAPMKK
ncbi:unnamed protein product [Rotaria sp. Silwood1]|nr:unnamed protein product [Rotaria sp. Silwood1]